MRNFFLADYPERSQMLFQDPASPVMEGIIDFHHDLTGLLIWIGLFVLWMTASALLRFKSFSPAYADRRHAHFAKVFTYFSGSPLYRFVRYASFPLLTLPAWRNYYVMRVTYLVGFLKRQLSRAALQSYFVRIRYYHLLLLYSRLLTAKQNAAWVLKGMTLLKNQARFTTKDIARLLAPVESQSFHTRRLGLPITHHTTLEVVWTIVPAFLLMGIAVPSFALLYAMDELVAPLITVKAVGRQWYWQYEYSDHSTDYIYESRIQGDATNEWAVPNAQLNRLLDVDKPVVLPQRVHVRLLITAGDVLHSFAVPSFGVKLDACPGRLNQTGVYAKRIGVFYGQCSELCGVNHAFMPISVDVVPFSEYIQWYTTHKPWLLRKQ